jgi:hypothetical protein
MLSVLALFPPMRAPQWEMVKKDDQHPDQAHVLIDVGFVVRCRRPLPHGFLPAVGAEVPSAFAHGSPLLPHAAAIHPTPAPPCAAPQITSRYGTEANKAAVDFNVYGPSGNSVHHEAGVSETEIAGGASGCGWLAGLDVCSAASRRVSSTAGSLSLSACQPVGCTFRCFNLAAGTAPPPLPCAVTSDGGQGPWRACFRVSKGQVRGLLALPCPLRSSGCLCPLSFAQHSPAQPLRLACDVACPSLPVAIPACPCPLSLHVLPVYCPALSALPRRSCGPLSL